MRRCKAGWWSAAALALGLLLPMTGCASGNRGDAPGSHVDLPRVFSRAYEGTPKLFVNYKLAPGDLLDVLFQIETWRGQENFAILADHVVAVKFVNLPNLSEIQAVRPNGMISLPFIGEISVVGLSVNELSRQLNELYKPILRDPNIYVTIADFRQRINELKKDLHTAPRGLSRLVTVRPDGYATFPMVGDIFVAGRSVPEIKSELDIKYPKIMPGMHVDLFLEKYAGARIFVFGEVNKPGSYLIQKPITVFEAVTLAGSTTFKANQNDVVVLRREEKEIVATLIDLEKALNLNEEFYYLQPDDMIYVPKSAISNVAELMQQIGDIILFRGWNVGFSYYLNRDTYRSSSTSRLNTPNFTTGINSPSGLRER